ncbi:SRPBCC family protein [Brachybacterium sp. JHP9]|uniref:SRPBCC family protein n=1 Tax=Brachybacterium equifaecis TaxID=2910770 RepID=A0ABT0QYL1_9MICO|nr:SRPBCC family protein [Brachybacterium equifaecis]MCL6422604.1 SRPBCC family protein [Brachybacterium equifaecis]
MSTSDAPQLASEGAAPRIVTASREIAAPAAEIFELIADPARQVEWDGNDNLGAADHGQRVRAAGDVFTMTLTKGSVRENRVVDFEEGRRIAWRPAPQGASEPGHQWGWKLEPLGAQSTRVTHIYDWSDLHDPAREEKARATTAQNLQASLDRLAALAEGPGTPAQ